MVDIFSLSICIVILVLAYYLRTVVSYVPQKKEGESFFRELNPFLCDLGRLYAPPPRVRERNVYCCRHWRTGGENTVYNRINEKNNIKWTAEEEARWSGTEPCEVYDSPGLELAAFGNWRRYDGIGYCRHR